MAQLSRLCLGPASRGSLQFSGGLIQSRILARYASDTRKAGSKNLTTKFKKKGETTKNKRKARSTYIQYDMRDCEQFSLCDAMRYARRVGLEVKLTSTDIYELQKSDSHQRL